MKKYFDNQNNNPALKAFENHVKSQNAQTCPYCKRWTIAIPCGEKGECDNCENIINNK